MFTDEFLSDTVVELVMENTEARSVSMAERIAQCGKLFGGYFTPSTGKWKSVPYKCNQWRECPTCLEDRATVERQKIELAAENFEIRTLELPADEMDDFCLELGKKNFRRYPGETLDRVFFILGEESPITPLGTLVDDDLLHELDWRQIVLTPQGRKLSGSLGYCPPAGSGSGEKIKVECVMSDASPELRQQAVQWAIDETADLHPTDADEVKEALRKRTYEYKSFLVANDARLYPSPPKKES